MESKKTKMENNDLFRCETNKEKRRCTHLSWTIVLPLLATTSLHQEPLTMSEIRKNENPMVSAF